jgi:hypothetical protein
VNSGIGIIVAQFFRFVKGFLKFFSKNRKNLLTNSKNGAIMHYTGSESGKTGRKRTKIAVTWNF